MTISFTNSLNYTRSFTTSELTSISSKLNSTNTYYTNGLNELLYIRVKEGNLLLLDLNDNTNSNNYSNNSNFVINI